MSQDIITYVYKITNKFNGMIYVGCRTLPQRAKGDINRDRGYLGGGTYIVKAVRTLGAENFIKEIIQVFVNDRESAFNLEKKLVNDQFLASINCYNVYNGGNSSCFGFRLGRPRHTEASKLRLSIKAKTPHPVTGKSSQQRMIEMNKTPEHIERVKQAIRLRVSQKHTECTQINLQPASIETGIEQ